MIDRRSAASPLAARAAVVLLLGTCALPQGAQAQGSSLYSATPRMSGTAAPAATQTAQAAASARPTARSARAVPLPLPRPPELDGEHETDQAAVEEPQEVAPLPNPPSIYAPQAALPSDQRGPTRTFAPPPPIDDIPHSAAANIAPRGRLPATCAALVQSRTMIAAPAPPVATKPGCSLPTPIQLSGVRLDDGTEVTLSPAAILRCDAATAIHNWVREDLSKAAEDLGSKLDTVRVAASYDCRPRNRVRGAKMSEHGQGLAMDVGSITLQDKRTFEVKDNGLPMALQAAMKASMCARFTTVLGPGSDGYHEDHIHVDLAQRRLNIRLCRWQIQPSAVSSRVPANAQPASATAATVAAPAAPAQFEAREEVSEEGELVEMAVVPLPQPRPRGAPRGS
ncbi:extensin family protein [Xanthobacteraceae bacterium A53D]